MIINEELLLRLEKLSSLKLDDDYRKELVKEFDDILQFVDSLNEIDTDNLTINNLSYTPLREDIPYDAKVIDDVLKHAPSVSGNFFSVPKIIE